MGGQNRKGKRANLVVVVIFLLFVGQRKGRKVSIWLEGKQHFVYSLGVWGNNSECFFEKERAIQIDQVIFWGKDWLELQYIAMFGGMEKDTATMKQKWKMGCKSTFEGMLNIGKRNS